MLRETAQCLGNLLSGDAVTFDKYPSLASHFNLMLEHTFQLNFKPKNPIPLYCGANGPRGLRVGGECMDGLIFGGEFKAVTGTGQDARATKDLQRRGPLALARRRRFQRWRR